MIIIIVVMDIIKGYLISFPYPSPPLIYSDRVLFVVDVEESKTKRWQRHGDYRIYVAHNSPESILLNRSVDLLVGLFSFVQMAHLFLDATYPKERFLKETRRHLGFFRLFLSFFLFFRQFLQFLGTQHLILDDLLDSVGVLVNIGAHAPIAAQSFAVSDRNRLVFVVACKISQTSDL